MRSKVATYLRANKYDLICLGLIFLAGLVPFIWLRHGMLVAYGDSGLFLYNSPRRLEQVRFAWLDTHSTGVPNQQSIVSTIFYFLLAILERIGFSPVTNQKLLFCSILILSGFGMYFLMRTFQRNDEDRVAAVLASFFYMFNPHSMSYIWRDLYSSLSLLPMMPWVLALYAKGLVSRKFWLALLVNLVFLSFVNVFVNPAFGLPFVFLLFLFFVFYVIANGKSREEFLGALRFSFLTLFLGVLLNLWWLLPLVQHVPFVKSMVEAAVGPIVVDPFRWMEFLSEGAALLNVFRMGMAEGVIRGLFIGFFVAILVFIPAFRSNWSRANNWIIFFLASSLLGLFLGKGLNPPLGEVFVWLFDNVPGFAMFRNFPNKFGPILMLSYAVLFGIGSSIIYHSLRKLGGRHVSNFFVGLLSISVLGFHVLPMWTGEKLFQPDLLSPNTESAEVEIPAEYAKVDEYLRMQEDDFRLISFPMIGAAQVTYRWNYGFWGGNPSSVLFAKPVVNQRLGVPFNEVNFMLQALLRDHRVLSRITSLLNVRYLLLDEYVDYRHVNWASESSEVIKQTLDSNREISLERTFGRLHLYKVHDRYFLPRFYVPMEIIYAQGDTESIVPILSFEDYKIKSAIFFQGAEQTSPEFILGKADHIFVTKHKLATTDALKMVDEQFFVPQEGTYEVLVYNDTRIQDLARQNLSEQNPGTRLGIEVNGVQQQVTLPNSGAAGKNWVSLGTIRLTSGNHSIRITSQGLPINDVKINNNLVLHLQRKPDRANPPEISFRKINPTRYLVEVKGATSPYLLVFSESFNPAWRAYVVDRETGRRERIPDERHFWVNGYANSWWVDKLGDYQIQVEFWPQRLVYWGAVISVITLISSVLYCFVDLRRKWMKI